jgi:hypothetical protein
MKPFLIIFVAVAMFSSCKNKNDNKHLSPKVMRQLLLDVHLAETYSTFKKDTTYKAGAKNLDSLAVYYKDIFAHYHITAAQFVENMEWYKNNPDDLDTIYNAITPVITGMQTKAAPLPAANPLPVSLPGK